LSTGTSSTEVKNSCTKSAADCQVWMSVIADPSQLCCQVTPYWLSASVHLWSCWYEFWWIFHVKSWLCNPWTRVQTDCKLLQAKYPETFFTERVVAVWNNLENCVIKFSSLAY